MLVMINGETPHQIYDFGDQLLVASLNSQPIDSELEILSCAFFSIIHVQVSHFYCS
jgi:hypothetical protein